jgi:signal transduction histidine kinase
MLTNLINDLLDLSKIDSLHFKFNEDYFNLIEVVQMAFKTVKYSSSKKNISLSLDFDDQVNQFQRNQNIEFLKEIRDTQDFFKLVYGD